VLFRILTLVPLLWTQNTWANETNTSSDAPETELSPELKALIAKEVEQRVAAHLEQTVLEAVEHHSDNGDDEGQITILGFRSSADRGFEANPDIGFATTYYDRGEVLSSDVVAPAIQPTLAISFGFGGYASLQSSHVMSQRTEEKLGDEVGVSFGYNNHTEWLDFDAGFTATMNPNTPTIATGNEVYVYLGTGDFLPHLTPRINSTFVVGGKDADGQAVDIGWYGQLRVDLHYEFDGPHAFLAGLTASGQVMGAPGFEWVDTTFEGFYLYHMENGMYVAPGYKVAYSFIEDRFIGLGTLNVGLTL